MKLARTRTPAWFTASLLAATVLGSCGRGHVIVPHADLDPKHLVRVHYEYDSRSLEEGDTLRVTASLTNLTSQTLRLLPSFDLSVLDYTPSPAAVDSFEKKKANVTFVRCGPRGEVSFRVDGVALDPRDDDFEWREVRAGASITETLVLPRFGDERGYIRPGTLLVAPRVTFLSPRGWTILERGIRQCSFDSDSTRISIP